MSLSPNAAQDKTRWRIPAEFPCCPTELTETPLQDYFENLKQGKIFSKTKQYSSSVLETALHEDMIIVKGESREINAIKPWSLCTITFENNLFVHRVYQQPIIKIIIPKAKSIRTSRLNQPQSLVLHHNHHLR